ncbi:hypothetical protein V2J09_017836 [Rumex salicifolius]
MDLPTPFTFFLWPHSIPSISIFYFFLSVCATPPDHLISTGAAPPLLCLHHSAARAAPEDDIARPPASLLGLHLCKEMIESGVIKLGEKQTNSEVSALLGRILSAVGYQPRLPILGVFRSVSLQPRRVPSLQCKLFMV